MKTVTTSSRRFAPYEPTLAHEAVQQGTVVLDPPATPPATPIIPLRPSVPGPILLQRWATHAVRKHRNRGVIRWLALITSDIAALLISRELLIAVRDGDGVGWRIASIIRSLIPAGSIHLGQLLAAVLLSLMLFRAYGPGDRRRDVRTLLYSAALGVMLVCWSWLWSNPSLHHLLGCVSMAVGIGAALVVERLTLDLVVRTVDGVDESSLRAIIVGHRDPARRLLHDRTLRKTRAYSLVGYVDAGSTSESDALGCLADLIHIIDQHRVDTIILSDECTPEVYRKVLEIADAAGCQALLVPRWARCSEMVPQLVWRGELPLVAITQPSLRGQQLVLKRAFDVVASFLGLIVLSPILLAAAIAVRLSSPGPIFFSQTRVGLGGRKFRMYKFRSMTEGAEEKLEELAAKSVYKDRRLFKVTDDPRITKVGRFLRRTSIDELPQLWNVLRGDMSLVGPRPPLPAEVRLYSEHHYARFIMKPGITGPWQVSGRNRITDFEEVVRIEKEHMHQWTFWKDIQILLRTIPAVLKMDGAS